MNRTIQCLGSVLAIAISLGCRRHSISAPQNLREAVTADNVVAAQKFIAAGENVNQRDEFDSTMLMIAIERGSTAMTDLLLLQGADVNYRSRSGQTALTTAITMQRETLLQRLVMHGVDVNRPDANSRTPLMQAIVFPRIVKLLLNAGADVKARDTLGRTVLFGAFDMPILADLVAHGADVNAEDLNHSTPIVELVMGGKVEQVRFLVAHGAKISRLGNVQQLLVYALASGSDRMLRTLIDLGLDVDTADKDGNTLLNNPFWMDAEPQRVRWLVDAGADIHRRNNLGLTARENALKCRRFAIADLLERYENGTERPRLPSSPATTQAAGMVSR